MSGKNNDFVDELIDIVDSTASSIKENIDYSLKNNGYDKMGDALADGIDRAFGKRPLDKPYSSYSHGVVHSFNEYMTKIVDTINYGRRNRGYYYEGYQQIIENYKEQLRLYQGNIEEIEKNLKYELRSVKQESRKSHNKFNEGKCDALEYLLSEMSYAKMQMMRKIQKELRI